ncbi:phosphogluconate dehydratase [Pleomorphomonas diazotrophica]|uniref:Phosphogluconate dehydratase n=1 Tax=Pleomorphomonas diazotrophica TaxID=1166257 RepID=A0A1I4S5A2_9HYPH|nr:phosphogluconate dehydratase [Pleomorphomonas diazotrophica]PKR89936.1 phosphogluconate dehydratase [Pleomorphomonas diazotrophica]SFM59688.1 6-phosphogluconate dehydratase [Pleomorphomonas diazotrophica]
MTVRSIVADVTERIERRSRASRTAYLDDIERAREAIRAAGPARHRLPCSNLAHGFAACPADDKQRLTGTEAINLGIVTTYNDMLSAHRPYERYPELIREEARRLGAVAEVAGGAPAMCDGITQGRTGMEFSLFSRDVIAMSTGIALSHDMFDAALMLGICDKIVPGLVLGALAFGHLPTVFVPSGPMPTGLGNAEKNAVRQAYAAGTATEADLLEAEAKSYHSPGTCTFFGTANTNQMLMEIMGLMLPGSAFVAPDTPLRDALTRAAVAQAVAIAGTGDNSLPIGRLLDARSFVNGIVGLSATGGSTNLTIHLIAMARAAGLIVDWDDFSALSAATPLLVRAYPNGKADVNGFRDAGGVPFLVRELRRAGLLHDDAQTILGTGLAPYECTPELDATGTLVFAETPLVSADDSVVRSIDTPFQPTGGINLLTGNLGRAVIKSSAVAVEHQTVEAPARVFASQEAFLSAFKAGLDEDFVAIVRFQGPQANGMPELHKLTPALGLLQDRGRKVALVTDGRMSGASGKVPAAIHVTPEAARGGPIGRVQDGDIVRLDVATGRLDVLLPQDEWDSRRQAVAEPGIEGSDRRLFGVLRRAVGTAEEGATALG